MTGAAGPCSRATAKPVRMPQKPVNAQIPAIHRRILADPATASFVNDGHLKYSGFFHFHDLAAKIYHERTSKTLARHSDAPPPARCCGDLYRYRLEETT